MELVVAVLQITLLDIILSGDNVSVIALAIRKMPEKQAKIASLIGVGGAVVVRILFTCIITLIMAIQWLPIKLVGGIILIKITWDLLNAKEEEENIEIGGAKNLWKAVASIIIADISMGLDNVLAIAGAAHGSIWLIVFGLGMSIPIIFFGAKFIANLMNRYKIIVYIGAGLLMYTALTMITEDNLTARYIAHGASIIISVLAGLAVVFFGVYNIKRDAKNDKIKENKEISIKSV
ncbi:TerC family protein [Clostridium sp. YIM B02500]|uniref:TerC family protein n=1 Tax=Clostridium sp. YIM B02500 TaxID=2910681 RepID=UPI001EEE9F84|nr:TerC family protein [Clostridium sp. YIM B02500]